MANPATLDVTDRRATLVHMIETWVRFILMIVVQLLFFAAHAYYEQELYDIPGFIARSVLTGVVLGLVFDSVLGKALGLWLNALGFDAPFVLLNGACLYGLFAANTLLMQQRRLLHFSLWTTALAGVSEVTNLLFHMWIWKFTLLTTGYLEIVILGNLGTSLLIAVVWHTFLGRRFLLLDDIIDKAGCFLPTGPP